MFARCYTCLGCLADFADNFGLFGGMGVEIVVGRVACFVAAPVVGYNFGCGPGLGIVQLCSRDCILGFG